MRTERIWNGWRGAGLVAVTYIYFLIFAQFGFLKRLGELGFEGAHLKLVMAAMAAGGILASLAAPRIGGENQAKRKLQVAFAGCAFSAGMVLLPLSLHVSVAVAFLIGSALGLLTVTLVTHLRSWIGDLQPLLMVGLGTGTGYLVCNLPPLFDATSRTQAIVCALLCVTGIGLANQTLDCPVETGRRDAPPFLLVLGCFTALVWLDSAAFFIIQNTPALKQNTWQGSVHLWSNGGLHLAAALCSAFLLRRLGLAPTLAAGFGSLACACLLLSHASHAALASVFYPVGVSLYSVALVAYPSLLAPASSPAERGRKAGWIYAVAGWIGSALGIGMGQNLGHIPLAFVLAAAALFLAPWLWRFVQQRKRESLVTAALLATAFGLQRVTHPHQGNALSPVERGRQVYIAEGCINCHSQYVRPHTADVPMWGPAEDVERVRREQPPLIGNRRQGPDLAEVGDRRSALWLKAHLIHPAEVSHASFMPSYAYLFRDGRGDALVAYLQSLGSSAGRAHRLRMAQSWNLSYQTMAQAQALNGAALFQQFCATCHEANGSTRVEWRQELRRLPPNLATGPFLYVPATADPVLKVRRIAQIVKFGIPGTDMPGHEYLPNAEVAAIAEYVAGLSAQR